MKNTLYKLNQQLHTLSVFRGILKTPVVSGFQRLMTAMENGSLTECLSAYGTFSHLIFAGGGNLTTIIQEAVLDCDNPYLTAKLKQHTVSPSMEAAFEAELKILQHLATLTGAEVQTAINFDGFLSGWENADCDLSTDYLHMLENLPAKGHGIFAKYTAFRVNAGVLVPVLHPDEQTIDRLYGYSRERSLVLKNTRALVEGQPADNVLLYGDAGTGKSSTIKACVNAFSDRGLRLIEFDRNALDAIPMIMEQLSDNPLRFIFYIDDLSFNAGDDGFTALKGVLEGSVVGGAKNIAIYATSNRRHFVKESAEARMGNDLHLNDTLQETMSLSARFGLTVTFSKPEKDVYLEIVKRLADEYGVEDEEDRLFRKAEAFAIAANGRSPRTAKQFIRQICTGLK